MPWIEEGGCLLFLRVGTRSEEKHAVCGAHEGAYSCETMGYPAVC